MEDYSWEIINENSDVQCPKCKYILSWDNSQEQISPDGIIKYSELPFFCPNCHQDLF